MWRVAVEDASLRRELTRVVHGIAVELRRSCLEPDAGGRAGSHPQRATDIALFLHYYSRATGDLEFEGTLEELLQRAAERLAAVQLAPRLYGGFCGPAFVFHQVTSESDGPLAEGEDDTCGEFDLALLDVLGATSWAGHYDLIGGLVGLGAYLLERLPRSPAREGIHRVAQHLEALAQRTPEGCTWHTPPALLPAWQRAMYPQGHCNLGMAHGVPGVVSFLALAHQRTPLGEHPENLLRDAVRWLRARRLPATEKSAYPTLVATSSPVARAASRFAWCYGDPGPAMALLHAGRALGSPELEAEGIELLLPRGTPDPREEGIGEAPLCHGAAGLLAVVLRAWNFSGDPRLLPEVTRWIDRTLAFYDPERWPGGFAGRHLSDPKDPYGPADWQIDHTFLTGLPGVGLALLAAMSDVEPRWDRLLMLS